MISFEAFSNNTNAEVPGLLAGTMYRITVFGVNRFGEGHRSDYIVGQTASPLAPLPPTDLTVDVQDRGNVCDVIFSWTVSQIFSREISLSLLLSKFKFSRPFIVYLVPYSVYEHCKYFTAGFLVCL